MDERVVKAQALAARFADIMRRDNTDPEIALTALSLTTSALMAGFSDGQSPGAFAKSLTQARDAFVGSLNRAVAMALQCGPLDPSGAWERDV